MAASDAVVFALSLPRPVQAVVCQIACAAACLLSGYHIPTQKRVRVTNLVASTAVALVEDLLEPL